MLIAASELHSHLRDPLWVVFDCRHDLADHSRGPRLFAEGHLPGARFAAVETDLSGKKTGTNGRHPLPEPSAFAAFLARAGVTPESTIVAYDDSGGTYATRLWWLARWIGHPRVVVLDGGLPVWLAKGFPVTRDTGYSSPSAAPLLARPGGMPVLSANEVLASRSTGRPVLLDARTAERFRGESEPIDRVVGRIPGAKNRAFKANLNADLTFRSSEALRAEFLALLEGARPQDLAHYCGSGVTACVNLFAMELAGLTGSQLFPGSWSEWIADPDRPVATGSA